MAARIPLSYSSINITALSEVLKRYENRNHQQIIADFEQAMCKLTGAGYAVAVSSGTAAIHLALLAAGIGKGDVVLAPTFTYVATINPIRYCGAEPVLIDCEPDTWNVDPSLFEEAIIDQRKKGNRVKALLLVHTYGTPAKMEKIVEIAEREEVTLIEDAAESLGAIWNQKMTGTVGLAGIFSFNNNKTFTTLGGGLLVTDKPEIAEKGRFLASQARSRLPFYEHPEIGFNYLMSALNAAYGLSQLPSWGQALEERRAAFSLYKELLGSQAKFQRESGATLSSRWLSTFIFDAPEVSKKSAQLLDLQGFETRPLWNPMHLQPIHTECTVYGGSVSKSLFERGICLPSGKGLKRSDQQQIAEIIRQSLT